MKLALLTALAALFLTVSAEARNKVRQTQCWHRAGVKTCNSYCW